MIGVIYLWDPFCSKEHFQCTWCRVFPSTVSPAYLGGVGGQYSPELAGFLCRAHQLLPGWIKSRPVSLLCSLLLVSAILLSPTKQVPNYSSWVQGWALPNAKLFTSDKLKGFFSLSILAVRGISSTTLPVPVGSFCLLPSNCRTLAVLKKKCVHFLPPLLPPIFHWQ